MADESGEEKKEPGAEMSTSTFEGSTSIGMSLQAVKTERLRKIWTLGPDAPSVEETIRPPMGEQETAAAPADDEPGGYPLRRTEDFELIDEIASGGMGVVYRAHQRSLERTVAIKKIIPNKDSRRTRQAFINESLVTGFLDHPNIVPVYELAEEASGDIVLAMKLVEGKTWKQVLEEERREEAGDPAARDRNLKKNLGILISVAHAVQFAHEKKGVIHRDLKPENVMIGEYGEVVVMDWGIALELEPTDPAGAPERSTRTLSRELSDRPCGTPVYMAPEMCEVRSKDLGPWTDVFLLGAVLHELLTGRPPNRGESFWLVIHAAAECRPKSYADWVPKRLSAIARQAMARDIEERTPSAQAFIAALDEYLEHHESLRLEARARDLLAAARGSRRLIDFASAVSYFEQSLELSANSDSARSGLHEAHEAYARVALEGRDFNLARSQAEALPAEARAAILESVDREQARAARARRRRRCIVGAAIILGAIAVLALFQAYIIQHAEQRKLETKIQALLTDAERRAERYYEGLKDPNSDDEEHRAVAYGAVLILSSAQTLAGERYPDWERRARDLLGRIFQTLAEQAERDRDEVRRRSIILSIKIRCGEDHPCYQALVNGRGRLRLEVSAPEAKVWLERYQEGADGALTPVLLEDAAANPTLVDGVLDLSLPRGRYRALFQAPGREQVRYPFLIERDRTWPDDFLPVRPRLRERCAELRLYPPNIVGDGFAQVPAGPFLRGPRGGWDALPYDLFVAVDELGPAGMTWAQGGALCAEGPAGTRMLRFNEWLKAACGVDGRPFPWGQSPLYSADRDRSPYELRALAGGLREWGGYHPRPSLSQRYELSEARYRFGAGTEAPRWRPVFGLLGTARPLGQPSLRERATALPEASAAVGLGTRLCREAPDEPLAPK